MAGIVVALAALGVPGISGAQTVCDVTYSGSVSLSGFTVPTGLTYCFDPNVSTTIQSTGNVVVNGTLQMRPSSATVTHTLRFTGANESQFVGTGTDSADPLDTIDPVEATDDGLWVIDGKLDVQGSERTAWTNASGSLTAGQTSITLTETPVGWRSGDILVFVPTGLVREYHTGTVDGAEPDERYEPEDWQRYDVRTIASRSGNTVNLSSGLTFDHPSVTFGGTTHTAEILNLTRNTRIEGMSPSVEYPRSTTTNSQGRSHIFILSDQPQNVQYAALRYMGPRKYNATLGYSEKVKGRYALHFHHSSGSTGSEVRGVVVSFSGSHSFVPHASDGVLMEHNIAHDVSEDAYWWDMPGTCSGGQACPPTHSQALHCSDDTTIHHSVASLVKADPLGQSQYRVTGFATQCGLDNSITHSVAVGVQGQVDSSGFAWLEGVIQSPWTFEDNLAHNNKRNGLFWWQIDCVGHEVDRYDSYRNGGNGIEHGAYANNAIYRNVHSYQDGGDDQNNNDDAAFWLVAGDHACTEGPDLAMHDFIIDGGGLVDHNGAPHGRAVVIDRKTAGHSANTRLTGFDVMGYGLAQAFLINEPLTFPNDDHFDIDAECWTRNGNDISASDWEVLAMENVSVLRVQRNDNTAFMIESSGSSSISNFATC